MNGTSTVIFRILYFLILLTSLSATAQAADVGVVWDGEQEPTPYTVENGSAFDVYAIIFPHNAASTAYTDNGWTAQIVTRAEWEGGSFTFTDPNGWTPPAPASIGWDTVFPAPNPSTDHNQVVAYWLGAGSADPLLVGSTLSGFWTDVIPDGEWPGKALDIHGNSIETVVTAVPLPLSVNLFLAGIALLLFNIRTGHANWFSRYSYRSGAGLICNS